MMEKLSTRIPTKEIRNLFFVLLTGIPHDAVDIKKFKSRIKPRIKREIKDSLILALLTQLRTF